MTKKEIRGGPGHTKSTNSGAGASPVTRAPIGLEEGKIGNRGVEEPIPRKRGGILKNEGRHGVALGEGSRSVPKRGAGLGWKAEGRPGRGPLKFPVVWRD